MALWYREWQRVRVLPIDKFNFISFIVNYFDQFTTTCQFIHPRQLFSTLLTSSSVQGVAGAPTRNPLR